jgi:hypothetical protein
MSRTILDRNMLTWEVYPSGGVHGASTEPQVVFNCLSNRMLRPRYIVMRGDEADAERRIALASNEELLTLFEQSDEVS